MQEVFEKIKERVCEFIHERNKSGSAPCKNQRASCLQLIRVCDLTAIVNQVAEEYKDKFISVAAYKQVSLERDIVIEQLDRLEEKIGNGWIPCSERLPEKDENRKYLVCGNKGGIYIAEFVCKTIDEKTSIGPWWSASGKYCPKPIAWRTLPEPYKGE